MSERATVEASAGKRGETGRLVDQFARLHEGGAWHGPSLAEAIEGLSAAEAARRPIGSAHSIWEIVHHARVTSDAVRRRLTGEGDRDEPDWPVLVESDEPAWRAELARLRASQRALREVLSRLPEGRLHDDVSGQDHSRWYELLGLLHHDAYHTGQISLLRRGRAQAALAAQGRSPEIPEASDAYGWLVGSWELDVRHYRVDVTGRGLRAEAHFGWILEGRAVQDVWFTPPEQRAAADDPTRTMLGTTLRVWDSSIQAWRVTWTNVVNGTRDELIGRRVGNDVVQVGTHSDGTPIRWCFTEITPDSFRWTGEALDPDGRTWRLEAEFLARRMR